MLVCDLSDQAQVRSLVASIKGQFSSIDLCIFSAACIEAKHEHTVDGIERQLAADQLPPFILSSELLPLYEASGRSTVVFTNSRVHRIGDPSAKMLLNDQSVYIPTKAYADR